MLKNKKPANPVRIGEVHGKLTVIEELPKRANKGKVFLCKCECGSITEKAATNFRRYKIDSCKFCAVERLRKSPGIASWTMLFDRYFQAAKNRNYTFSLSIETFKEICGKNCTYCGKLPGDYNRYVKSDGSLYFKYQNKINSSAVERGWIKANGIDRKNNDIGYEVSNCLPCCGSCNKAKLDMSYEKFLLLIKNIYEHLKL